MRARNGIVTSSRFERLLPVHSIPALFDQVGRKQLVDISEGGSNISKKLNIQGSF
jgi:hypothetical protein